MTAWLKSYMAHPFGKGATLGDYAMTGFLAVLILLLIWRFVEALK